MMRLALLLPFVLIACVAKPPPIETITGQPIPEAEVKQTLLTLARTEWLAFGGQRLFVEDGVQVIKPVGLWEDDRGGSALVAKYWQILDPTSPLTGQDCDEPWSAAFISWLMIRAGVDSGQFQRSNAHRDYIRKIVAHAHDVDFKLRPRRPADYAPRPGDIVCRGRGRHRDLRDYTALPADAELHCDLVVATAAGRIEVIGGNVRQSVSWSDRVVDAQGRLGPPWFVVIENRYRDPPAPVAFP